MLISKKSFLNSFNLLTIKSFNNSSINKYIWNIRNNIRYIFFFLLKKSLFLKQCVFYRVFVFFTHIKFLINDITLFNEILNNINVLYLYNVSNLYKYLYKILEYRQYIKVFSNIIQHINVFANIEINKNKLVSNINKLFIFYRDYTFICFLWLYSIKFLFFFKLPVVSMPKKTKRYLVLRSPHKDKRSREKFVLTKIKKTFYYPSFFFNSNFNLLFFSSLNEQLLLKHSIKKSI